MIETLMQLFSSAIMTGAQVAVFEESAPGAVEAFAEWCTSHAVNFEVELFHNQSRGSWRLLRAWVGNAMLSVHCKPHVLPTRLDERDTWRPSDMAGAM